MKKNGNNNCGGCGDSVRALAASAGIQFGDLQTEAFRLREQLGPDHQKAFYEIVRQLARGGAISEAERRTLLELGKRGFAVGSDREADKFVAYVQGLHKRMLTDRSASPVALAMIGAIANYVIPSNVGRRGRALARAAKHPIRNILLGVAGGAFGGLRMSGWNPIGGVVGGIVGGIVAAVESLC
ncbi:MAG: hypothetical protein ACM3NN_05405 [Nitrospirota bacterium]